MYNQVRSSLNGRSHLCRGESGLEWLHFQVSLFFHEFYHNKFNLEVLCVRRTLEAAEMYQAIKLGRYSLLIQPILKELGQVDFMD